MFRAKQESESYRKLGLYGSNRNWGFRCNFPEKTDTKPARTLRLGPGRRLLPAMQHDRFDTGILYSSVLPKSTRTN